MRPAPLGRRAEGHANATPNPEGPSPRPSPGAAPRSAGKPDETEHDQSGAPLYVRDPDTVKRRRGYKLRRDGENLVYEDTTFVATILPDGRLAFRDRGRPKAVYDNSSCASLELHNAFDLTDTVMRAMGGDPYAFEKRRFARATARMRSAMRRRHHKRVGQQALAELPLRLSRLWRRYQRRPARLRRLLFQLWDECAERRGRHDRRREARLGVRAREIITRYVAARLPAGSPLAYRDIELRRLNRSRHSRSQFRPYGRGDPASAGKALLSPR